MFVVIHCVWLDISHVIRYTTYNQKWSRKKWMNERTKIKLINKHLKMYTFHFENAADIALWIETMRVSSCAKALS